jgi:phenylalanyl-tRNA synthetase beta chain
LDLRLFELGRVFLPIPGEALPVEPRRLGGAMTGSCMPDHWSAKRTPADVFHLKGALEGILEACGIGSVRFEQAAHVPFLQEGKCAGIRCGTEQLGWMGEIAPQVRERWDLELPPLVFELDFEAMARRGSLDRRLRPLPRFPEVLRDLSIVVRDVVPAGDILEAIGQSGLAWLQEASVLDVFAEGEKLPVGHKSLTFRIRYRSDQGNLTDEEVNAQQGVLLQSLEKRFGVRLRS